MSCTSTFAEKVILTNRFLDGEIKVIVDDQSINPTIVKKYLVIHPIAYDPNYYISPSISLCIDLNPNYYPCGSRDINDDNFLRNAQVNITIGKENLKYLNELKEIPELADIVCYFQNSLEFGVWRKELLLKYFYTWNIDILRERYKQLPVTEEIKNAFLSISQARSKYEKWKISFYKWSNAVNKAYREQEGNVPIEVWKSFINKYKIIEEIKWDSDE